VVAMRLAAVGLTDSTSKAALRLRTPKPDQQRTPTHLEVTETHPGHSTRCQPHRGCELHCRCSVCATACPAKGIRKLSAITETGTPRVRVSEATRWGQLIFGIICMVMIANLQYGWTLFVNPIDQKYHWGRAAIQVAFTIFVLAETWLVPIEGYLIDKFGPRS
jgi:hypothetical protein